MHEYASGLARKNEPRKVSIKRSLGDGFICLSNIIIGVDLCQFEKCYKHE